MSTQRPVLAIVTPWFPNPYEPVLGIFVAQQVEALRTEMDVRLIHLQLSCELPGQKFRDRLRQDSRRFGGQSGGCHQQDFSGPDACVRALP